LDLSVQQTLATLTALRGQAREFIQATVNGELKVSEGTVADHLYFTGKSAAQYLYDLDATLTSMGTLLTSLDTAVAAVLAQDQKTGAPENMAVAGMAASGGDETISFGRTAVAFMVSLDTDWAYCEALASNDDVLGSFIVNAAAPVWFYLPCYKVKIYGIYAGIAFGWGYCGAFHVW